MTFAFLVDSVPFTKAVRDGETSLGGSESACLGLARALVPRGHQVHIFATQLASDAAGVDAAGVVWHPAEHFAHLNQWIEWDVVCALRMAHWFSGLAVQARLRMLWNQDLLIPSSAPSIMAIAWALDKMAYVSSYHRLQWEDVQPELVPLGWVTKNGYDPSLVPTTVTKDPNRIIHISRPERGLGPLLAMWPEIRKQRPHARLQICRYQSMYDGEGSNVRALCLSYDDEVKRVNEAVGGIEYLGSLNKAQLYQAIAESAVMWYPGIADFAETSCIAAIEAQACGTPFVGSYKGALPETIPSGYLVKGDAARDVEYQQESIARVISVMDECKRNSFAYRKRQQAGREHVKAYTFTAIAAEWDAQIDAWFHERYAAQKGRILEQLLHEDDHCAAKFVAEDIIEAAALIEIVSDQGLTKKAYEASVFCDRVIAGLEQGAADYAAHAIQDPLAEVEHSERFKVVHPKFKDCRRVLDVACGNGAFAIGLAMANPDAHVYGFDYAAENIAHAKDGAQRAGVADRCHFTALTVFDFDRQAMHADWMAYAEDRLSDPDQPLFDGLFVGEFVEHVANCALLIDELEKVCEDGARVIYTCPMGPFGELVPRGQLHQRGHVHCFKHDDIKAVWGNKKDTGADFFEIGLTPRGNPIGHWIIHYAVAPGRAAGERDLRTRVTRTRPLSKLSVGLITKDAELDLARCLDSVYRIADEIVVGDTGSADTTVAIAESFGARILRLDSVMQVREGFAGARNAVLDAITGDWLLWIDADEVLVGAHYLRRYIDGPVFQGFVIHQNHLQLDAPGHYDIPIRLFRAATPIRFYGCVHEQPQWGDANTDIHPTLETFDLQIAHTGYLTDAIRGEKMLNRNRPLLMRDQQVFSDRILGKVLLLREAVLEADRAISMTGGQMNARAHQGYVFAIQLFNQYVADPAHKYHTIARPWYQIALQRLGMGFEMELALAGKHGGLGQSHAKPERVWVRDAAELRGLIEFKLREFDKQMTPAAVKTDPFPLTPVAAAPSARVEASA